MFPIAPLPDSPYIGKNGGGWLWPTLRMPAAQGLDDLFPWLCVGGNGRRLDRYLLIWLHLGNGAVRSDRAMTTAISGLTTGQAAHLLSV